MSHERTLPNGTTVRVKDLSFLGQIVILDHPDAPEDMRNLEAGRIIGGGFQPAPNAEFALTPDALRAIADLIEEPQP